MLHVNASLSCGHDLPPYAADDAMERERLRYPLLPHDAEHLVNLLHGVMTQSAAHAKALQEPALLRGGHGLPPNCAGRVMLRERSLVPVPHDLSQWFHAPHAETAQ